ncbi:hypothetical protein IFR05_001977 [Cadophora sp. M221]|nr:hypothetical protein IFR05_001977 [Cadophora sp. M221]
MPDPISSRLSQRPWTVGFIENRLPALHEAFINPPVHWDSQNNQYVSNSQALVPVANDNSTVGLTSDQHLVPYSPPVSVPVYNEDSPPPRPVWNDTKPMLFWQNIFHDALIKFKSDVATPEPKGRSQTPYSIRNRASWNEVYDTLELARSEYQKVAGPLGWIRKVRRKGAENIAPFAAVAQSASDLAPNDPYSTPVLGAVGLLLSAVKQAASVRNQVLEGFENLIPIFSDVELFLGTFPNDPNIKNMSVQLTVTTLIAIEQAIGFFTSNELLRGTKAILMKDEYGKKLLTSLEEINTISKKLMSEATKSHFHQSHLYSQETQKTMKQVAGQQQQLVGQQQQMVKGMNSIENLLAEYLKAQDMAIERKQRELENSQRMNMFLTIENQRLRSTSPMLPSPWAPPPQPQVAVSISQEAVQRILGTTDFDYTDIAFILDKKEEIPARQRAQAEQIVNTTMFRHWIVSTSSARLLVQWTARLPKTIAEVSPLSIFCATMAQALHAKERFISMQFFCGRHIDVMEDPGNIGGRAILLSFIAQLFRHYTFDMRLLYPSITTRLHEYEVSVLEDLLNWMVRQLPPTITLFCIIDGVFLYEREEHCEEALPALAFVLSLTADPKVSATVKVLFTSTPGPDTIRTAFSAEDQILNVEALPQLESTPSDERLMREFEAQSR